MKRYLIITLSLAIITGLWLWASLTSFYGLNTIQQLTEYNQGILGNQSLSKDSVIGLRGPEGPCQVIIDTLGIPHVFGDNDQAVSYAVGYMHARDRYFQMELLVYAVMGRLSEIIGEEAIGSDKLWKPFEFEDKAKEILDSISRTRPDLYSYLEAYTKGVNDYLDDESRNERDPMYLIWGVSPRPWKPFYSLLVQWYMSFDLTFYDDYINRQELLDKLPEAIRQVLYPSAPATPSFIIPGKDRQQLAMASSGPVQLFRKGQPNNYPARSTNRSLGSNNWVVGASLTAGGQLFLCNDLHLFLTSPNIFYELQLHSPQTHVYGFTIPGVPLVLTGHNEKIAWGITNGGWDVTEQYLLKIDPARSNYYWLDGKWQAMTEKRFTIQVKNGAPVEQTVQYTVFGKVVRKDSLAYGLQWHPSNWTTALQAFWMLRKAANWSDFKDALRWYDYPAQNFAYGDINGNIGMFSAGKMPVKPEGYAGGLLDGTHATQLGYVPFDSLPQVYNPSRDFIFSANQQPENSRYYYSSHWFEDLYRPGRINALLSQCSGTEMKDMQRMQMDITDNSVKDLQQLLSKYTRPDTLSRNWGQMMNWEGELKPGRTEAVFYKLFRQAASITGRSIARNLGVRTSPSFDQLMNFLLRQDSVTSDGYKLLARDCFAGLMHVTDSLYLTHSGDDGALKRDYVSAAYAFSIPQMTFLPGLDIEVDNVGGSDNTINVNYGAHPVIRTIVEIREDGIQSWMVNAIGQTGRINEPGYIQQLPFWEKNTLHKTQFTANPLQLKGVAQTINFHK